jgi:hypothetical protein
MICLSIIHYTRVGQCISMQHETWTWNSEKVNTAKFLELKWCNHDYFMILTFPNIFFLNKTNFFPHFFTPRASGRIQTLDLWILSWLFYHCATELQPTYHRHIIFVELSNYSHFTSCNHLAHKLCFNYFLK